MTNVALKIKKFKLDSCYLKLPFQSCTYCSLALERGLSFILTAAFSFVADQ